MNFAAASSLPKILRDAFSAKSLAFVVALALTLALAPAAAFGQCTLSSPTTWTDGNGNWSVAGNWSGGVPTSSTNTCITDGTSTVTLNVSGSTADLQLASGNVLNFDPGNILSVFGTQIINAGQINVNSGGGANAILELDNNVTLSGGGKLTLTNSGGGGTAIIDQAAGGLTLTNQSTIQGTGEIGFNGLSLINQGTVDANTSGQTLDLVSMSSGINNAGGLLRASNGGLLFVDGITVGGGGTITATTGGTVQLVANTDVVGGTLNNIGGTLGTPNGNSAILDGSTGAGAITLNGTYINGVGSITEILGTIKNNNNFQLNAGGGANSILEIGSNLTLQGGGTVTMSNSGGGGQVIIDQAAGGLTLTNVNNTIQGAGTIGFNGLTVVNEATINANASGQTLFLESITGALTNTAILEASNGGTLNIDGITVNNAGGGSITANAGSTVVLIGNTTIQGGTLNNNGTFLGTPNGNSAILDGSTGAGAITLNGTYTNGVGSITEILGTIKNNNNFQLNAGGGANSILEIGSNLTLQGGGTVTMSNSGGGGQVIIDQAAGGLTLTNVNNTIQGAGTIGFNGLTVVNEATINANASGQTLFLESITGALTNTAILEASNGGTLNIDGITVNNAGGGSITANAGSTVVLIGNTTIQGGTLNNNGTFLGTPNGNSAILDGSTGAGAITLNGTYINGVGSTTDLLGTINNNNNFLVTAGSGNNSVLTIDSANVTLQGGGTVTLSTATSGGNVIIDQAAGGEILTNVNNTIQGDGIIGFNGLTIVNEVGGTINANSLGGSEITTLTIESAPVTNQGLIEATNNGVLNINGVTINNQGGTISANGAGASVQLFGNADIQGGTLTNNGGAFFGTPNGNTAILDGSTVSGAVTINGTYTNGNNSATFLLGTINNQGNIQVNGGSGNNSELEIDSATVTLTGGGMVTLSTAGGGGSALVFQAAGGETLENFNNTIQGAGIIGFNGLSLLNDVGGTVLANAAGQTLSITGAGTVTNNGTFQANSGSTLLVGSVTSFTNFSGNTLTGGTYNVYGTVSSPGMLQINPLGNTGGEIVNNAATIYLNGPNSNFVDSVGLDALSNFSNNTSSGSFTITNGRNFTSPSSTNFANAGAVIVGSGSTFTTAGTRNYTQSGGSTQLNGSLVAGGGQANFTGGVLYGNGGAITGNVSMAGTIAPAATINGSNVPLTAGSLSITGNYSQTSAGIFNLGIGGLAAGSQFGFLGISGNALIDGTLNVNLINSFFPAVGNTFTFLTTGGSVTGIFATVNGLNIGNNEQLSVMYGANYVEITTLSVTTTDNWLGGTGNWSNGAKWSIGVPASIDDVNIYSGGNDLVTLNLGSTTINSLALGGPTNGFTSELTDGGTAQNLSITNGLSIGANGFLDLTGASTITAATVSNSGSATIGSGATLNLTNQPNGVTSVASGASWTIGGNFSVGGVANTGFANLSSVGGSVTFANGASQTIGSSLTVASGGFFDVEGGSTVTITGNVFNNAGGPQGIYTSFNGTGGNTLNINGNLTNNGMFGLESTDAATIGGTVNNSGSFQLTGGAIGTFTSSLMNTGTVDLENASTLTINGTADNFGTLSTSANGGTGSNNLKVSGLLTNEATGQLSVNGPSDTLKAPGGLTNYGAVTVKNGSTIDPPFVNNLGTINIDATSTFVVGTGTATGPGFIQLSNGTFGEMINSATAFGQVDVAGSASLNGTLDILLHAGYNPAVGTSFTYLLLNPGQLSGTYSNILNDIFNGGTEKWVVNYNDAGGYVQLTAATNSSPVPEPGSFLLLGSGLIGLAYTARRRWMK